VHAGSRRKGLLFLFSIPDSWEYYKKKIEILEQYRLDVHSRPHEKHWAAGEYEKMGSKKKRSSVLRRAGTVFVAAVFIAGSWFSWKYRDELRVPLTRFKNALDTVHLRGQVRCSVASTVDGTHYLRMKLAIPCEDRKQRLRLTRNLPRFKNQLMMKMSEPEMKEAVKNRDFETIRHHVIKILNTISKKPVNNVYFEGFIYD